MHSRVNTYRVCHAFAHENKQRYELRDTREENSSDGSDRKAYTALLCVCVCVRVPLFRSPSMCRTYEIVYSRRSSIVAANWQLCHQFTQHQFSGYSYSFRVFRTIECIDRVCTPHNTKPIIDPFDSPILVGPDELFEQKRKVREKNGLFYPITCCVICIVQLSIPICALSIVVLAIACVCVCVCVRWLVNELVYTESSNRMCRI